MRIEKSWEYLPSLDREDIVTILVFNTEEFIQFMKTQPVRYYSWCPHPFAYSEEFVREAENECPNSEWTIVVHPDFDGLFANWDDSYNGNSF